MSDTFVVHLCKRNDQYGISRVAVVRDGVAKTTLINNGVTKVIIRITTNLVVLDTIVCSRCVFRRARWTRIRRFPDSCCAQPIPAAAPGLLAIDWHPSEWNRQRRSDSTSCLNGPRLAPNREKRMSTSWFSSGGLHRIRKWLLSAWRLANWALNQEITSAGTSTSIS